MQQTIERRLAPSGDVRVVSGTRAGEGASEPKLVGYGAVFYDGTPGTEYQLAAGLKERINPKAFDKAIAEKQDVAGLANHDPNILLARTSSGTMKISVDNCGLKYEMNPNPAFSWVIESVRRRDMQGSSFSFGILEERWILGEDGTDDIREILSVNLYDCGPVVFPAYIGSSVGLRADDARAAVQQWQEQRQQRAAKIGDNSSAGAVTFAHDASSKALSLDLPGGKPLTVRVNF